jgi:hypothetical protein
VVGCCGGAIVAVCVLVGVAALGALCAGVCGGAAGGDCGAAGVCGLGAVAGVDVCGVGFCPAGSTGAGGAVGAGGGVGTFGGAAGAVVGAAGVDGPGLAVSSGCDIGGLVVVSTLSVKRFLVSRYYSF